MNRKKRKGRKMARRWVEAELRKDPTFTFPGMNVILRNPTHSRAVAKK